MDVCHDCGSRHDVKRCLCDELCCAACMKAHIIPSMYIFNPSPKCRKQQLYMELRELFKLYVHEHKKDFSFLHLEYIYKKKISKEEFIDMLGLSFNETIE